MISTTTEEEDARKVDAAIESIRTGDFGEARQSLEDVISRTPAEYAYQYEEGDSLIIKFWDVTEFVHHVTRTKGTGQERKIVWKPSAYPRAHYYLGFLEVKEEHFDRALEVLEAGERLEPNPHFLAEKAQALVRGPKNYEKALALYDRVLKQGEAVPGDLRAMAMRGMGFALIELNHLDLAEGYFRESLRLEPDSRVAANELAYIARLRAGGDPVPTEVVDTGNSGPLTCTVCRQAFKGGKVANHEGRLIYVCGRCHRKMTKKWWQFWK
jgi:tetratricopeptide (TPR) repeat protein